MYYTHIFIFMFCVLRIFYIFLYFMFYMLFQCCIIFMFHWLWKAGSVFVIGWKLSLAASETDSTFVKRYSGWLLLHKLIIISVASYVLTRRRYFEVSQQTKDVLRYTGYKWGHLHQRPYMQHIKYSVYKVFVYTTTTAGWIGSRTIQFRSGLYCICHTRPNICNNTSGS